MKQPAFKKIFTRLLITIAFLLNISCPQDQHSSSSLWVGVGITPDKEPPEVHVTSHSNAGYMRKGDLVLKGSYSASCETFAISEPE